MMQLVLTKREWMLLELLIEADDTLFECALAVHFAADDPITPASLHPEPMLRERTRAALLTLYHAGFIEMLQGPLMLQPNGVYTREPTQVVPAAEAWIILHTPSAWDQDHWFQTKQSIVLSPTEDGMRYGGVVNDRES